MHRKSRASVLEVLAVFLLIIGWGTVGIGQVFGVVLGLSGLLLLYRSKFWTSTEKKIGLSVSIFSLAFGFVLAAVGSVTTCTNVHPCPSSNLNLGDVLQIVLLVALAFASVAGSVYLLRQKYDALA